jgi:hypothetical protein
MRSVWVNRFGLKIPEGPPTPEAEMRDLVELPEWLEKLV